MDSNLSDYDVFVERFGGASFQNGLYRVIRANDADEWRLQVLSGFPEFSSRIKCFGYDWAGTVFALDSARLVDGKPGVVMFEPGTGNALEVPSNLQSFHDVGQFGSAALESQFHKYWLDSGGAIPKYDECVGYKVPLFLGGKDEVENMEISDNSVYWHLMSQLIRKTRGLPKGVRIKISNQNSKSC